MPVGNVRMRSDANMPIGKVGPQTAAALALRLGVKAGLGKNVKAAQKQQDTSDQRYALAMADMRSGGRKSGKTAAVAKNTQAKPAGKSKVLRSKVVAARESSPRLKATR